MKEFPLAEEIQHDPPHIKRHCVLRGWGAGLNNLHLECIRLLCSFFLFYIGGNFCWSFDDLDWPRILPKGVEMAFRFWETGWMVETSMQKDGDRLFMICFYFSLPLLFPCCSSIQNLCVIIRRASLLWHPERLSLVFFFY